MSFFIFLYFILYFPLPTFFEGRKLLLYWYFLENKYFSYYRNNRFCAALSVDEIFQWIFHFKAVCLDILNPVLNVCLKLVMEGLSFSPLKKKKSWNSLRSSVQFSSVQSLSHVQLFATPWIAARQASLCISNSLSSLRLMSIELVMPSSHLILCHPLLLLPPIPPSIRVFSNESTFRMRWPKYWSFSFSISPSKEDPGLISFRMNWLDLLAVQGTPRVFSNTTVQKHQFFGTQLSSQSNSHIHSWPLEKP